MIESVVGWAFLHRNSEPDPKIHKIKMTIDAGVYLFLMLNAIAHNEMTQTALLVFTKNDPRLLTRFLS